MIPNSSGPVMHRSWYSSRCCRRVSKVEMVSSPRKTIFILLVAERGRKTQMMRKAELVDQKSELYTADSDALDTPALMA